MKLNRISSICMLCSLPILASAESYRVVELPINDLSTNQFARSIDNTGLVLSVLRESYNPPIDLSLIDLSTLTLEDADAAAQGNFTASDLGVLAGLAYDRSDSRSSQGQKLARDLLYSINGDTVSYVYGLDVESDTLNGYTFAQRSILGDSVNGSHIVASMDGPYREVTYVNSSSNEVTYVINDFGSRAFVQTGDKVTPLIPDEQRLGGISEATAINSSLQVAGTSGIGIVKSMEELIEACSDDDSRGDIPVDVCLYRLQTQVSSNNATVLRNNTQLRATIWQLDTSGEIVSKTVYDLPFQPDAEEERAFGSQALDINNAGVAVGASAVELNDGFTSAAVSYIDGKVERLINDDDLLPNTARGINDNDFVVGTRIERINGSNRARMFILNRANNELEFVNGFFSSSGTLPRAINNNNLVVGDADSDNTTRNRRRTGFLYNIDSKEFVNINRLLACDSPYDIIAANDINDSDVIVADAVVSRPLRNAKGEIVLDENGNQSMVNRVISVMLEPTGGSPSDCGTSTSPDSLNVERQGASISLAAGLALLLVGLLRRRSKS